MNEIRYIEKNLCATPKVNELFSQSAETTINSVNDRMIKIVAIVERKKVCHGVIGRLSLGNITEKLRKAEGIMLGPTKLIRAQNNFHIGSLSIEIIKIQIVHSAQPQENIENDRFTRLYLVSLK